MMGRDAWGRPMPFDAVGAFVDRFVWVETYLKATPMTLPHRLEQLTSGLQAEGWTVLVRSVATDFEFAGVPVPKVQKIVLGLHQTGQTRREAIATVKTVAQCLNEGFSPLRAYVRELEREVVRPTLETVQPVWTTGFGTAAAILLALAVVDRIRTS